MFGGDIDCFAGDALLVVFDLEKSGGPHQQRVRVTLQEAVSAAVECAIAISKELNGYEASPGYPALSIHAALAAGSLFAVECGK